MFTLVFQYFHSLPPQDAANLAFLLANTCFFAILGLAGYFTWDAYESRKLDKEMANENHEENVVENIEHIVYEHGTNEFMIEIHHYADPLKAKFLRIIRNITTKMDLPELLHSLQSVLECMEIHKHMNFDDMELVFHVLSHQEYFSHETVQYAKHWLHIAKTYWLMYPSNPMITFSVPMEEFEHVDAERCENRSKSF